jgi:hypothetical protein
MSGLRSLSGAEADIARPKRRGYSTQNESRRRVEIGDGLGRYAPLSGGISLPAVSVRRVKKPSMRSLALRLGNSSFAGAFIAPLRINPDAGTRRLLPDSEASAFAGRTFALPDRVAG